jgi:hypothetical protein
MSQFAINVNRGAERIIHFAREALKDGKAVIRVDVSNAFNMAQRSRVQRRLAETEAHDDLQRFFQTMYAPTSQLAVFGERGRIDFVASEEGMRQGDSLSSWLFCTLMDEVCAELAGNFPNARILCYMDDVTVLCDPDQAAEVTVAVCEALRNHGFKANVAKSAVACRRSIDAGPFPFFPSTECFTMLGGNITENHTEHAIKQMLRLERFFHALQSIDVHPQIKWTINAMCGRPKMIFYASVTPPEVSGTVLAKFEQLCVQTAEKIVGCCIPQDLRHHITGAAIPRYIEMANDLYVNSRTMTLTHAPVGNRVSLASNSPVAATLISQHDAEFMYFRANSSKPSMMSPHQYALAMQVRMRALPAYMSIGSVPQRCDCGTLVCNDRQLIEHAVKCDKMACFTYTERHEMVKDALMQVCRDFGIRSTPEPRFYRYPDGRKRPDITFWTAPPIVTDITVVTPADGHEPGTAAMRAASEKTALHNEAVTRVDHVFIPFAMETFGHRDESCILLITKLSMHLQHEKRWHFAKSMAHAVSSALAKARAIAVSNAAARTRDGYLG